VWNRTQSMLEQYGVGRNVGNSLGMYIIRRLANES
jgi:hypothetical protein